ncbi:uncharacterized protein J3D65DRAFT_636473 [Phyllosticta citribraziliensis]|uniref:Myb-like domain-containing protein n=1 Tax=Phyllosticta citribraziliensis TaxID=989973 RepID=A0ABR1LAR9_9PEZI
MSNNGGKGNDRKDTTPKRGRGDLELEAHPRVISTSAVNTEAPTEFVLRGRPLERPVYNLRSPSAARRDSNSTFPGMFDSEMEDQQETASTPSPGPSRPERSPQTPVPSRQMVSDTLPSDFSSANCVQAPPPNPIAGPSTQASPTPRPEATIVTAATTPRATRAQTRQHARTSSTEAPSTPVNASASGRPPLTTAANPFALAPTPPATPSTASTLATPSPSNTRSPSRAWTAGEEAALAESVRYVVENGGHDHPVLEMWEVIGRRVRTVHDVQKTGSACRLWYCRKLRAETGFDERKVAKANKVTCSQKPGFGGRRKKRDDDEDERGQGKAGLVG